MPTKLENCPDSKLLTDYLLGKLPRIENESCETHIAECPPCIETIRSLKIDDTLDELTRAGWPKPDPLTEQISDSQFMDRLIDRMREIGKSSSSQFEDGESASSPMQDRAAEVQRLFEPAKHSGDMGQLAHYRIQQLLGAGSTGVVYRAVDEQLQRTVALKILRPSLGEAARARFIAEARATAAIDHSHVITIYHVGSKGPLAYIAMQWLPGETLEQRLKETSILPVDDVKSLGCQIAEGLMAAHSNGLIHRDIKPANIWLESERGQAKILDFGLVRITDEDPQLTCTGMIAGTPCFMSPEQSRGAQLDGRSDIFSLGCLLYQALTGRLPFCSNNALATLQLIQRDQPAPPNELDPGIPNELSDLVMCLLEKSPNHRPPTVEAVANALQNERENWTFPVQRYASAIEPKPAKLKPAFSRLTGTMALMAILLLGAAGIVFRPQITRIVTNQGELIIESDDKDIQIEVLQNGERVRVIDLQTEQSIDIVAGSYQIRPLGDQNSVSLDRDKLTLSRGGKEILKVTQTTDQRTTNRTDSIKAPVSLTEGQTEQSLFRELQAKIFRASSLVNSIGGPDPPKLLQIFIDLREEIKKSQLRNPESLLTVIDREISVIQADIDKRLSPSPIAPKTDEPYLLDEGDVLAIYIEGILGNYDEQPPIHYPDPSSGLIPCMGYPVPVRRGGTLSLPLIDLIPVRGLTIEQAEELIKRLYCGGDEPILKKESARIMVSIMRRHDYVPMPTGSNSSPVVSLIEIPQAGHKIDSGDVLGIFIEGVLGTTDGDPPINYPDPETGLPPSIGFPIPVRSDGMLSLPIVDLIPVRGKTIEEVEALIKTVYTQGGDEAILRSDARILVNLMRVQFKWPSSKDNTTSEAGPTKDPVTATSDSPPLYDGKTYEEWLEIAKRERDIEKLLPAIPGVSTLVQDHQRKEMIEVIVDVFRRNNVSFSSKSDSSYRARQANFLARLTAEEIGDVYVNELQNGTKKSREMLLVPWRPSWLKENDRKAINGAIRSQIDKVLTAAAELSKTEELANFRFLSEFIASIDQQLNLDPANYDELIPIIQRIFYSDLYDRQKTELAGILVKYRPNTKGLVVELINLLKRRIERKDYRLEKQIFELLEQLPSEEFVSDAFPVIVEFIGVRGLQFDNSERPWGPYVALKILTSKCDLENQLEVVNQLRTVQANIQKTSGISHDRASQILAQKITEAIETANRDDD